MNNTLTLNTQSILAQMPETVEEVADPSGVGVFLKFAADKPADRHVFLVGIVEGMKRFTCCHRYEPFWMKAMAGTRAGQVRWRRSIYWRKWRTEPASCIVPLMDGPFRMSLARERRERAGTGGRVGRPGDGTGGGCRGCLSRRETTRMR